MISKSLSKAYFIEYILAPYIFDTNTLFVLGFLIAIVCNSRHTMGAHAKR